MKSLADEFTENGFVILDEAISLSDLEEVTKSLNSIDLRKAGTRNVLSSPWCQNIARSLKMNSAIAPLLPCDAVVVQCTYFEKSIDRNWLVAIHRDYSIPVKARISSVDWSEWSEKEGFVYGRPPESVLDSLVAIRVHLDENTQKNGPLQVIPGSHRSQESSAPRVTCLVKERGALVMRPKLLHASSKLAEGTRRVLHFLYGPDQLPNGAEWAHAESFVADRLPSVSSRSVTQN
jgi:Phytanoyl-CoA dioxygenase (PhyH)